MRVLIVEDDADLRRIVRRGLEEEDLDVEAVRTGHEAIAAATARPPELLVLDIGLPDSDGRDVCQALRVQGVTAPVIFLTARDAVSDRLAGFTAGGDDYLTKPFALAELIARVKALLKRSAPAPGFALGDLKLDPAAHAVSRGEKSIPLTPTEFRILGALAARPEEAVRRRELIATGWPDGAIVHDNTLDVYVARLRRKLRALETEAEIATVRGVGYTLR